MKKIYIGVIIAILILLIAMIGFYNLNSTDSDIHYYSGENIQPESYKVFQGSWFLENSKFEDGFTLNADSTATSINMATLMYKKWKIEDSKLVLTAISMGNHTASVFDEKYMIKKFNDNRLFLEMNGNEYIYKKSIESIRYHTNNANSLNTSFEYFPADVAHISKISNTKHSIDFDSNPKSKRFETTILQHYNTMQANFAGYYTVIVWGCGSGCKEGVIVDTRDGKIYNLPSKKGYSDIGNYVKSQRNSILLMTSFTYSEYIPGTTNREEEVYYWLWNESAKEFLNYKSDNKIIKN